MALRIQQKVDSAFFLGAVLSSMFRPPIVCGTIYFCGSSLLNCPTCLKPCQKSPSDQQKQVGDQAADRRQPDLKCHADYPSHPTGSTHNDDEEEEDISEMACLVLSGFWGRGGSYTLVSSFCEAL